MNKQEALKDYKHLCDNCREMFEESLCEECASKIAIECIEKHIPQKPIVRNYKDWSGCKCGMKIYEEFRYCPYCGQAILWAGDNE